MKIEISIETKVESWKLKVEISIEAKVESWKLKFQLKKIISIESWNFNWIQLSNRTLLNVSNHLHGAMATADIIKQLALSDTKQGNL